MSRDWPKVKLGEVLKRVERAESPIAGTVYRQLGVKLWGEGAYERESIDGSQTKYATLSKVQEGDVVVNKIWARNGSVSTVNKSLSGCFVSGEFPTFTIDQSKVVVSWIYWMTKTKWFWTQCSEKSQGTSGQNRIKPEQFLSIEIPLPPLAEQERIVARIEELAGKISEACELRKQAVEEGEALIVSYHLKASDNRTKKLNEILNLREIDEKVFPEKEYSQVGVRSFGAGLFKKSSISGGSTTYKSFNKLFTGAVVMSQVKGWEGAIDVCDKEFDGLCTSPEYRTFECISTEVIPAYFKAIIRSAWFWSRLGDATRGVGARRERTRPDQFLNIEIPMPTIEQQRLGLKIAEKLKESSRLKAESEAEWQAMLPAILDKAFKGEL